MRLSHSLLKMFRLYMAPANDAEGGGGGGDLPDDADSEGGETDLDLGAEDEEPEGLGEDGAEEGEGDEGTDAAVEDDAEDDDGALSVTIAGEEGDAEEEEDLPEMTPKARKKWAELRIKSRENHRKIKELEDRLAATQKPSVEAEDPGPAPKIEDVGIDFDTEVFVAKFTEWSSKKNAAEKVKERRQQESQREQEEWKGQLEAFAKGKTKLGAKDFQEAEDAAKAALSIAHQAIIVRGLEEPAKVVYALGKSPKHLAKLAAIHDPVKFACAIARLETKMTVTTRKAPPAPERVLKSSVAGAAAVDNPLERLRELARKTGNYSKVMEHKRNLQEKARKKSAA